MRCSQDRITVVVSTRPKHSVPISDRHEYRSSAQRFAMKRLWTRTSERPKQSFAALSVRFDVQIQQAHLVGCWHVATSLKLSGQGSDRNAGPPTGSCEHLSTSVRISKSLSVPLRKMHVSGLLTTKNSCCMERSCWFSKASARIRVADFHLLCLT